MLVEGLIFAPDAVSLDLIVDVRLFGGDFKGVREPIPYFRM